jgi:ribosomal subunit interface protein
MNIKISFHNMPHSEPLELHAREKLGKIEELLKAQAEATPFNIELWLKANKLHPHHAAELHIKTPIYNLHAHDQGADMYIVIDTTIDTMIGLIKKEKERMLDKFHKPETDKKKFSR